MKVLQINSVCGVGSTGKIAVDLYNVLKSQGHECKIAYARDEAKSISKEDTIKIGTKADYYTHALMSRITDRTGFYSKRATKEFIKKIIEFKPDIIHLHNIHGYYINIKILFEFLKETKIPVVWTLHDSWAFTGHCAYFDYIGCSKWETECKNCPQIKAYPKSYIDKSKKNYSVKKELFNLPQNMIIVTPSDWLNRLTRMSFLQKYDVRTINNGIDLGIFKPTESDIRGKYNLENYKIILGVAKIWGKGKGFDDMLELANKLDDKYKLVMIGVNKKQIEQLPENVIGITCTNNQEELAQWYTAADIFVNPTRQEVFGLVNVEALACGTPVVMYKTGGSPETIDEDSGIVVEEKNIESLINAIEICEEKNFTAENCKKRSKLFDKNVAFDKYVDVYKELIEKNM